jgi:hypothetical protein
VPCPRKLFGTGLGFEKIFYRFRPQELPVSRRRISADNEFSMFSAEQIVHESGPSHRVAFAWATIVTAMIIFWFGVYALLTGMSL